MDFNISGLNSELSQIHDSDFLVRGFFFASLSTTAGGSECTISRWWWQYLFFKYETEQSVGNTEV